MMENWNDVLTRNEHRNILIENLVYCQKNKGLKIFVWSRALGMKNHMHLIAGAIHGTVKSAPAELEA
jgi:hypothetical protein